MENGVQVLIEASRKLTRAERLELLSALMESIYRVDDSEARGPLAGQSLDTLKHTPTVTDVRALAADFWPDDETADDLIDFIYLQRQAERAADL